MHLLNKLPEHLVNVNPMSEEEWKSMDSEALLAKNAMRAHVKGIRASISPDFNIDFPESIIEDPMYKAMMDSQEVSLFEGQAGDLYVDASGMVWWCEAQQLGFHLSHANLGMFAIGDESDSEEEEDSDKDAEDEKEEEEEKHFFMIVDVPVVTLTSGEEVKPLPLEDDSEDEEEDAEKDEAEHEHEHEHEHEGGCCDGESIPPFWAIRLWGKDEDVLEQIYAAVVDCARLHPNGENMEEMEADDFEVIDGEEVSDDNDEECSDDEDCSEGEGDEECADEECGNCECHDDEEPAAKEARME